MPLSTEFWVHVVGTVGAACLLLAYFLVSKGKVEGGSRFYQLLNVVGSIALAVNTGYFHAWPSMALNVVWIFIGVAMLRTIARAKQTATRAD